MVFPVTLVGAGRYGMELVGGKYAHTWKDTRLVGVIDPYVDETRYQNSPLSQAPLFRSLEAWRQIAFKKLAGMRSHVIDLAVSPEIIPEQFQKFVSAGVRQFILPKPVALNEEALETMAKITRKKHVKACVSSNWFYSGITQAARQKLDALQQDGYRITHVDVNYSKQLPKSDSLNPVWFELPHTLQILSSLGLADFNKDNPSKIAGTRDAIQVDYNLNTHDETIRDGIHINCDLQAKPGQEGWRQRLVNIRLQKGAHEESLVLDYDALFDKKGKCVKPGNIQLIEYLGKTSHTKEKLDIQEDNIDTMYTAMFNGLKQSWRRFSTNPNILSLERYLPIAKQIARIHTAWYNGVFQKPQDKVA